MFLQSFLEVIRTPVKSIVLVLIFAASITAVCLAVNYDNYVRKNTAEIEKSFITIAIPDTQVIRDSIPDTYEGGTGISSLDRNIAEADLYLSLRQFVNSSLNGRLDSRELLRGVSNSVKPVLSGTFEALEYDSDSDTPRNAAVFIVTAMEVEYAPKLNYLDIRKIHSYSGCVTEDNAVYVIKFRIDKTIVLNPGYKTPEFVYVCSGAFAKDLKCPYEIGKQYFISGLYYDVQVIQKERDNGTPLPDTYFDFDEKGAPNMHLDGSSFVSIPNLISDRENPIIRDFAVNGESTTAYTYSENELDQMRVSYDGDLNALLTERPDIAKRLENARVNAGTVEICTTDELSSVPYFNQGKAMIMTGRNFTDQEVASGSPVCVVSERFATYNNLKVGDSFSIDLYNPIMTRRGADYWIMTPYLDEINAPLHDKEISRGTVSLNLVGIYITPPWDSSAYALNDNIIFMPSKAVPVKYDMVLPEKAGNLNQLDRIDFAFYSPHSIPALFTVIIPNGKLEAFKAEAEAAGYGAFFTYNDQGYSQIKELLPVITGSTRVFVIASLIGFLAVFVLYLVLLLRKRQKIGMLLSLGAKRSKATVSVVFGWAIIIVPALILCFIAVIITGAPFAKAALNSTIEQLKYNDAFSAGAQESTIGLTDRFSSWTNDYVITAVVLIGIFVLFLTAALIVNILLSKKPVLKLLRRSEG